MHAIYGDSMRMLLAAVAALIVALLAMRAWSHVASGHTNVAGQPSVHIIGRARVVDGDTISIGGIKVRLEGIDAPEIRQTCLTADGGRWPAGKIAARTLAGWAQRGDADCRVIGHDRYGRVLAACRIADMDVNTRLVREDLAWAFVRYSKRYVGEERAARRAGRGIWTRSCDPAWTYRRRQRLAGTGGLNIE